MMATKFLRMSEQSPEIRGQFRGTTMNVRKPVRTCGSPRLALLASLIVGLIGAALTARADDDAIAFDRGREGVGITIGGKPFARYVFGNETITRPFFESVHAPGGTQVTRHNPPIDGVDPTDHATFHPGLWLAFGDLNGADFWRNHDPIRHAGFVEEPKGGPGRGVFAARHRYEKDGRVVAEEICRITILTRPAGSLLLWDSSFRPNEDELIFGDQEEMGLGVRLATPLTVVKGGRIQNSEKQVNEAQVWGQQAAWCACDGTIGGRRVVVALMPHPENFRRSWFHARDYGLLVANPFGRNAFTKGDRSRVVVRPGETLRLRFGVLVANGDPDLNASYRDYLREATLNDGGDAAGTQK